MALNPSTNSTMAGRITAPDANYPYGSSKDETSAGAGDGTPYFKARADDIFGFQQWLLNQAGIVPSGNADNVNVSDYGDALIDIIQAVAPPAPDPVPSGVIAMWSGSAASIPSGWLLCDGTSGTPNLINRFIKGSSTPGGTGGSSTHSHADTFSVNNHTLTISQIPSHDHTYVLGSSSSGSSLPDPGEGSVINTLNTGSTGGGGSHNHGLSGSVSSANNEPPYYDLAFIIKV